MQIDDVTPGGKRAGHAYGGRRTLRKSAFVAALQMEKEGKTQVMRLDPVNGFTTKEFLKVWGQHALAPTAHVVSYGTACFAQSKRMRRSHERHVRGICRNAVEISRFTRVNTVLGNQAPLIHSAGVCAAEGIEAKRAKTEDHVVLPTSPGWASGRGR
ncbi:MAG: hypothetical protein K2X78_14965 [Burkholderiaceae bacterium]|nr:hypothetical protein [Burkholderiaceae bacterium]